MKDTLDQQAAALEGDKQRLEKLNLPRSIIVTSGSAIKIKAVEKAFALLIPSQAFAVQGVKVESGINEQPVGEETEQGARNRATNARATQTDEDKVSSAVLSIENGIFAVGAEWEDRAVAVLSLPDGRTFSFVSRGVLFPKDAVEEAQAKDGGFTVHTVGSVLAEKGLVADKQDPHTTLTNGMFTREQQLVEAIRGVLLKAAQ